MPDGFTVSPFRGCSVGLSLEVYLLGDRRLLSGIPYRA